MGDAKRFIIHDIIIAAVGILVAIFWDCLNIKLTVTIVKFSIGAHQIIILCALVVWLAVSLNRLRYYS